MIIDSVLNNAKAYLKGEIIECSLAIEEGRILKIGKETNMPKADEKIDLHHLLVLPGIIDSHVHLRDEDKVYKESFQTGTAAAALGGVTTVLDMPNNSPPTNSANALLNRMQIATRRILVNVGFYALFPFNGKETKALVAGGAIGFKLFMAEQIGELSIDDDEALKNAFKNIIEEKIPVAIHAEDHKLLNKAVEKMKIKGRWDVGAFLKAHNEVVEAAAVDRLIKLVEKNEKIHFHFCHISTEEALNKIAKAKKTGRRITCEVTPHHLLLSISDYDRSGFLALTKPPLRTKQDIEALWRGISKNIVDTIGSDHAPHTLEEKNLSSVWDAKTGIPGLETMLPLIITMVHKGKLTLSRAVELLCEKPAEIFHLSDRGRLEEGNKADLVVVNFNQKFRLDATLFKTKAKFSPFDGWEAQGKPIKTYVNGCLVMDEGEIVTKPGSGRVIRGPLT